MTTLRKTALVALFGMMSFLDSGSAANSLILPIPMKRGISAQEMTLTLQVPEKIKPIQKKRRKAKKFFPYWNSKPLVKVDPKDEVYDILRHFARLNYIKSSMIRHLLLSGKRLEKYFFIDGITEALRTLKYIKTRGAYERHLRKTKLRATDIDDLLRLVDRYEKQLKWKGIRPKEYREILTSYQVALKETKRGILKVVRVEGKRDGSTVLHLVME